MSTFSSDRAEAYNNVRQGEEACSSNAAAPGEMFRSRAVDPAAADRAAEPGVEDRAVEPADSVMNRP